MPSRADVQRFQRSIRDIQTLVEANLRRFWATIDTSSPQAARVALDKYLPPLVQAYGETAALVAADYYDELRAQATVRAPFSAQMADPASTAQAQGANRWAVGPLGGADAAQALANVLQVGRRLTVQPARLTIAHSAGIDPGRPKWARVPTGAKTCAFCLLLASRGFAYHSAQSAGRMNEYHADCDCQPVPDWTDDPRLDGYNPDALYSVYSQARDNAAGHSTKAVLAELRQQEGIS
jgi:hypothetical protein